MRGTVASVLSVPNDSIGSPLGFVSPWIIDLVAVALVGILLLGDIGNDLINGFGFFVAGSLALWAALRAKAIHRYITDTPRSKISSAAQGFVEVQGRCEFYGNRETQGFMSGPPCVWHRYLLLRLRPIPLQVGASEIPFIVRDDSGVCVVDPTGAKIVSSSKRSWSSDGTWFSSSYIRHGTQLYVVGEIRADGCSLLSYNENAEVGSLLVRWKKDKPWLLEEFDVDRNGELDTEEWASAVKRAKKISRDIFEQQSIDRVENVIRRPRNGMPMLISDRHPDQLATQFFMLSNFNAAVAVVCMLAGCNLLL